MNPEYAAVVHFDCCLSEERDLLNGRLRTVYDQPPEELDPASFGLTSQPFFERDMATASCYRTTEPANVIENLDAIEGAEAEELDGYSLGLRSPRRTGDLSSFEMVSTLVLQRETRNFLEIVTVGRLDAAITEQVVSRTPKTIHGAIDRLRRDLLGLVAFYPGISAYERPVELKSPHTLFYVDGSPRITSQNVGTGTSTDQPPATVAPNRVADLLEDDATLSKLLGSDEETVSILQGGTALTHRESGDHWGPLVAVHAGDRDTALNGSADESTVDRPQTIETLYPVIDVLLPYYTPYFWVRSRFGDIVDIEEDVQLATGEPSPRFEEEVGSEIVRETTDVIANLNSHRDICAEIADEFHEITDLVDDLVDDAGSEASEPPAVAVERHELETGTASDHLTLYRNELVGRVDKFERHFESITEKLEQHEDIFHDQLTGYAARINLESAQRNVDLQESNLDLQKSIRRLTWVLILLTVILTLEALWAPITAIGDLLFGFLAL